MLFSKKLTVKETEAIWHRLSLALCDSCYLLFNDTIAVLQRKETQLETYRAKVDKFISDDDLLQNIYYILLQAALFYGQGIPMAQLVKLTDKSQKTIKIRLESMPKEHLLITTVNRVKYYKLNLLMFK